MLMLNLLQRSEGLNRKHRFIPLDVILRRIDEIKPVLESTYGVTSLFYYGSYAKNIANEYSDLDLFVEVDSKRQEDEDNKYRIKGYLEKELGITVDCHVRDSGYVKSPLRAAATILARIGLRMVCISMLVRMAAGCRRSCGLHR